MNKLKGFTLVELVIGMIISSIVMGSCYMGYGAIYKQFLGFRETKKEIITAMQFNSVFSTDFTSASECSFLDGKIILLNNNAMKTEYIVYDQFIVRNSKEVIDTFNLPGIENMDKKFLFGDESSSSNLLNEFSFDAQILKGTEHFDFVKEYSAQALLKFSENNPNGDPDK